MCSNRPACVASSYFYWSNAPAIFVSLLLSVARQAHDTGRCYVVRFERDAHAICARTGTVPVNCSDGFKVGVRNKWTSLAKLAARCDRRIIRSSSRIIFLRIKGGGGRTYLCASETPVFGILFRKRSGDVTHSLIILSREQLRRALRISNLARRRRRLPRLSTGLGYWFLLASV